MKRAKSDFEKNIARNIKTDNKAFWKYVQSKTKVKGSIEGLENENGDIVTDNREKANVLNDYFSSVFTKENLEEIPEIPQRPLPHGTLLHIDINEEEVYKLLNSVNTSKSQGVDRMHPKFLVETSSSICKPLTIIYRKSLEEGKLPMCWKTANISVIHKKGPKTQPNNYRPISLTSIPCKVLEKIVRQSIMDHMDNNGLFSKHQHGFRSGRSCVTQLLEVLDRWTMELDSKNKVDTIYLDFRKAFDTVPHQRLMKKLYAYGVRGEIIIWIEEFLKDRQQRVVLNGETSDWTNVTSGIPQGSVLGPILFLIYINDLPDIVRNIVKLFADDIKLYARVNTECQRDNLQTDINNLVEWSETWQLRFNSSKCKHLHLGNESGFTYHMEGKEIEQVHEEKDLGVIVDSKLKFQTHIASATKKANRVLGLIRRTFTNMDKQTFLCLFKSLVRPHLEYGSAVWSVIYKKEAVAIENVQRRATKILPNIRNLSYSERLLYLGLPSLQYRRMRADMIQVFKILNGIDSVESDNLFTSTSAPNNRGNSRKLQKRHCRLDIRKYFFSQRIVNIWNSLSEDTVTATSVNSFKDKLNILWKEHPIKFAPDCYNLPEVTSINVQNLRRIREAEDA